jgi:hypothetical protein
MMAPTPAEAARLREATLARLLKQHRIRKINAETALDTLRAPVLNVAAGVTEAAVLHLRSLVARLRRANREVRQAERKLDELCAALTQTEAAGTTALSDAAIVASLPGAGKTTLAALLTEASGPLTRRDYAALRTLSGVAPVNKRSGKTCIVVMRYAAQARLRPAVFHWARGAVQNEPKSHRRYEALRARGHSYGRALRGVADRHCLRPAAMARTVQPRARRCDSNGVNTIVTWDCSRHPSLSRSSDLQALGRQLQFFCSVEAPFFCPGHARGLGQDLVRQRQRQPRSGVLTEASTVSGSIGRRFTFSGHEVLPRSVDKSKSPLTPGEA